MGSIAVFFLIFCNIFKRLGFGLDARGVTDKNALFNLRLGNAFLSESNIDLLRMRRLPSLKNQFVLTIYFCIFPFTLSSTTASTSAKSPSYSIFSTVAFL